MTAACGDCGLPYEQFPLDVVLPDADWLAIHPEGDGGLLCAGCIARRAAALPTTIVLYARLVSGTDHDAFTRLKNEPLATLVQRAQEIAEFKKYARLMKEAADSNARDCLAAEAHLTARAQEIEQVKAENERVRAALAEVPAPAKTTRQVIHERRAGIYAVIASLTTQEQRDAWGVSEDRPLYLNLTRVIDNLQKAADAALVSRAPLELTPDEIQMAEHIRKQLAEGDEKWSKMPRVEQLETLLKGARWVLVQEAYRDRSIDELVTAIDGALVSSAPQPEQE
jgi:hypothetical protein